jgi:hypothetical protein
MMKNQAEMLGFHTLNLVDRTVSKTDRIISKRTAL